MLWKFSFAVPRQCKRYLALILSLHVVTSLHVITAKKKTRCLKMLVWRNSHQGSGSVGNRPTDSNLVRVFTNRVHYDGLTFLRQKPIAHLVAVVEQRDSHAARLGLVVGRDWITTAHCFKGWQADPLRCVGWHYKLLAVDNTRDVVLVSASGVTAFFECPRAICNQRTHNSRSANDCSAPVSRYTCGNRRRKPLQKGFDRIRRR